MPVSAVSIIDIYRRHLVKDRDDRHYLVVATLDCRRRQSVMILGAIWFSMAESKTLQDTLTMLTAVLGGGLFGLYMLGMLTTRGNGRAALCGIVCTILFTTWTLLAKNELLPPVFECSLRSLLHRHRRQCRHVRCGIRRRVVLLSQQETANQFDNLDA